jgi:hypothetical protein
MDGGKAMTLTLAQVEARNVSRATGIEIPTVPEHRTRLHHRLVNAWGSSSTREWNPGQGICKVCGTQFCEPGDDIVRADVCGEPMEIPTPVCAACSPFVSEHYHCGEKAVLDVSLTPQWDELCPPRFAEAVEMNPLPRQIDLSAFRQVTDWTWRQRGLYVVGPTGTGKSTSFWSLARKLERTGNKPVILRAIELNRQLQNAARDLQDVDWLCRCSVLMIDDLGKEKASAGASALLAEVIDARYGNRLPLILTTQFASKELAERFSEPGLGVAICRRLYEICDGVQFQRAAKQEVAA